MVKHLKMSTINFQHVPRIHPGLKKKGTMDKN